MYTALIIALVILLYTLQSLFTRLYTDHYPGDKGLTTPVFAVICGLIVTVVSFIFSGFTFSCGWLTVLLGVINAFILYGYDAFIIKASATGPYSILMTFSLTGGIVVPAIVSWLFFEVPFSVVQLVSILIIFASVLMISKKENEGEDKEEHKKHRTFFLIICTLLGLANGLYGVLLNVQQELTGVSEKEEMVAVTFIGAAVISLVQLVVKEGKNTLKAFKQTKLSLAFLLLTALVSALAINALVIALEGADTTLVYTFDNAGVLLLSAIASAVFFKEKLSRLNIIGCIIMSIGLICMSQYANIELFLRGLFA
ncbi:MAG: EamA family transporter [Clostridia bacterium]|nr:EamA family transporter [Clostridia bacterium]MBQ7391029.1 EamA family transporter [Clostridia bacterium]